MHEDIKGRIKRKALRALHRRRRRTHPWRPVDSWDPDGTFPLFAHGDCVGVFELPTDRVYWVVAAGYVPECYGYGYLVAERDGTIPRIVVYEDRMALVWPAS